MKIFIIRYILYLIRWQLSTPILAVVPLAYKKFLKKQKLTGADVWKSAALANLIGGLGFYWIDSILWLYLTKLIKLIFNI